LFKTFQQQNTKSVKHFDYFSTAPTGFPFLALARIVIYTSSPEFPLHIPVNLTYLNSPCETSNRGGVFPKRGDRWKPNLTSVPAPFTNSEWPPSGSAGSVHAQVRGAHVNIKLIIFQNVSGCYFSNSFCPLPWCDSIGMYLGNEAFACFGE
jgi:hypothetical protein